MSEIIPRIGNKHTIYAARQDFDPFLRMCVTKKGTIELELDWVPIEEAVYNDCISLQAPSDIDYFADETIKRRKYETAMVA